MLKYIPPAELGRRLSFRRENVMTRWSRENALIYKFYSILFSPTLRVLIWQVT